MKIKSLIKKMGIAIILTVAVSSLACGQDDSNIEVKNVEAIPALVIKAEVPTSEIGPKIGEMYKKLFEYSALKNIQPVGAPFAVYYSYDPNGKTSFEAGFPVTPGVEGTDSIAFKEFPSMKVVTSLYKGTYENMGPTYDKIQAYLTDHNLKSTGKVWEIYLTDPQQVKDPSENKTIIYFEIE